MKKVFVGLSGGVDSAVSAAILKKEGYDVTGVFIKIWSPEFLECTWQADRLDAMRVAVFLDIPFKEIDLSQEYRDSVIADMIGKYRSGRTPNPDVLCNETIKFGAFAHWAFKNGADYIATGHYARVRNFNGRHQLLKGIDPAKDQSYFLYRITEKILSQTLFPVGGFTKKEIREKAREFKLPNAQRPDSQGLCFVGDVSMNEFLGRFIPLKKGALLDFSAKEIGTHDGAALYTMGQRHGFYLAPDAPEGPYYVTKIDIHKNIVYVSKQKANTESREAVLTEIHWIGEPIQEFEAVPRYHAAPTHAFLDGVGVKFSNSVLVSPGQSLVFYKNDECLGGALIHSVNT